MSSKAVRERRGVFLVEGPQAVREAVAQPGRVTEILATPQAGLRHPDVKLAAGTAGIAWHEVDPDALASVAETVHSQGLLAIARLLDPDPAQVWSEAPRLVAGLCEVRDPGNAGTVIRCADAAGADAVALLGASVDPHNGKCVRASAGSLFHLPVLTGASVSAGVAAARRAGMQVLGADGGGAVTLGDPGLRLQRPTLWLFGQEAAGLSAEQLALADAVVRIPLYGRAESLNLAAAAVLCLYASAAAHR